MNITTTQLTTRKISYTPYCFESPESLKAAEKAINDEFFSSISGVKAYATERTLFVPSNKSLVFMLDIEAKLRRYGGRRHTE